MPGPKVTRETYHAEQCRFSLHDPTSSSLCTTLTTIACRRQQAMQCARVRGNVCMPSGDIPGCESLCSLSRPFQGKGNPLFASASGCRANPMTWSLHPIVTVRAFSQWMGVDIPARQDYYSDSSAVLRDGCHPS